MTLPRCSKCRGPLGLVIDYTETDGKIELIKCGACSNIEASRRAQEPAEIAQKVKQPPATPAVAGKQEVFSMEKQKERNTETVADRPARRKNSKKRVATCLACGRPMMTIVGRGLCGQCYGTHHRAGTLDAKYPALQRQPPVRKPDTPPTEPETAVKKAAREDLREFIAPQNGAEQPEPDRPKTGRAPVGGVIRLTIEFSAPRDRDLYAALVEAAEADRRTVGQQMLSVLEGLFAGAGR
jgi:hypothetical protein